MEVKNVWIICVPEDFDFSSVLKEQLSDQQIRVQDMRDVLELGNIELRDGLKGIREADQIIIVLSKNSLNNPTFNVQKMDAYIGAWKKRGSNVLPIVIDDVTLTPEIAKSVVADYQNSPEEATAKLAHMLRQGISQEKQNYSNIHILTSLKGGVGKTLTGLSVVGSYRNKDRSNLFKRKLLVVDMNHMNTDLYSILRPFTKGIATTKPPWQYANLPGQRGQTNMVLAHASGEGFQLPLGAKGFWNRLIDLLAAHEGHDAIVDTNLNFANLINGLTVDELTAILDRKDSKFYFWIFWTYASLSTAHDVLDKVQGTENLLMDVWNLLPREQKNRVEFIHVLNPAGMVTLHPDQSMIDKWVKTANYLMRVSKQTHQLHSSVNDESVEDTSSYISQTNQLLRQVEMDLSELVLQFIELNTKPRAIDGLRVLRNSTVEPSKPLEEFVTAVSSFIKDHKSSPDELFASRYDRFPTVFHGTRPVNFFPLTTYIPALRGYTDRLAIEPISRLSDIMKATKMIEQDIGLYLDHLTQ